MQSLNNLILKNEYLTKLYYKNIFIKIGITTLENIYLFKFFLFILLKKMKTILIDAFSLEINIKSIYISSSNSYLLASI